MSAINSSEASDHVVCVAREKGKITYELLNRLIRDVDPRELNEAEEARIPACHFFGSINLPTIWTMESWVLEVKMEFSLFGVWKGDGVCVEARKLCVWK